jgi:hypothetical protein
MGEVGKSAVADLAAETKRLAKEDSGRGVGVGHCGDIPAYIILNTIASTISPYTCLHNKRQNLTTSNKTNGFSLLGLGTSA